MTRRARLSRVQRAGALDLPTSFLSTNPGVRRGAVRASPTMPEIAVMNDPQLMKAGKVRHYVHLPTWVLCSTILSEGVPGIPPVENGDAGVVAMAVPIPWKPSSQRS